MKTLLFLFALLLTIAAGAQPAKVKKAPAPTDSITIHFAEKHDTIPVQAIVIEEEGYLRFLNNLRQARTFRVYDAPGTKPELINSELLDEKNKPVKFAPYQVFTATGPK